MKLILAPIIVVLCIITGAAGAYFLKSGTGESPDKKTAAEVDGHRSEKAHSKKDAGHSKKKDKKDGHGGKHGKSGGAVSSETYYFKFSREFVVPIMQDQRVKSLVILNINLETDTSQSETLFSLEPKLRDNIMTTLVGLSNDGVTLDNITDVESYETIRSVVLMNLNSAVSSDIKNVLILDVGKQDL